MAIRADLLPNGGRVVSWRSCCCGGGTPGCILRRDFFSVDRLATWYDIINGDWAVSGGVLSTSDDDAVILANIAGLVNTVKVKVPLEGELRYVFGAYTDDDNKNYLEISVDADGYILVTGSNWDTGVETRDFAIRLPLSAGGAGDWLTVKLSATNPLNGWTYCLELNGTPYRGLTLPLFSATDMATVAFGVGSSTGTAEFDDIVLAEPDADEAQCALCDNGNECIYFSEGTNPATVSLEITYTGTCDVDCVDTFNLELTPTGVLAGECQYDIDDGDGDCMPLGGNPAAYIEFEPWDPFALIPPPNRRLFGTLNTVCGTVVFSFDFNTEPWAQVDGGIMFEQTVTGTGPFADTNWSITIRYSPA